MTERYEAKICAELIEPTWRGGCTGKNEYIYYIVVKRDGSASWSAVCQEIGDDSYVSADWAIEQLNMAYDIGIQDAVESRHLKISRPEYDLFINAGIIEDIKNWVNGGAEFKPDDPNGNIMTIGRTNGKV